MEVIRASYEKSSKEKQASKVLKLKIKQFLESVKSSLDYSAWCVFYELCRDNITSKLEDHERVVYFPIKENKNKFDKYLTNIFPGLSNTYPDIASIFENVQRYSS
ncbi:hypothetical protein AM598_06640, partial [Paenibacillus polymyxa]